MKHHKSAQQAHPHIETVRRLHALCNAVRSTGTRGSKARIEFVQLAYRYGLVEEITTYACGISAMRTWASVLSIPVSRWAIPFPASSSVRQ
ncbi:hypothetical protein ACFSKY_23500 [Azotobacter chroococcum]|uniref:Uncharacterized protein n=1 Tax=Azotobacter chroococcum TaxID=353 RepID=A0A4R1NTI4_9GAMM|nr:hypothetical protein [Azotobacter chroococcum]QQE91283.1 hypothetical protein GKQ51_22770 [Azotobacter chroococcum]TCL15272.1 hypothetical protein EV691_17210 [Azotobacter chroococcum]